MICQKCKENIPDESKFCKECGHDFSEESGTLVSKDKDGQEKIPCLRKPETIRVLIVDDTAIMRLILRKMLDKHGFVVAGEASDAEDAIENYKRYKPDLVLMDISMPGTKIYHRGGLDAIKDIITIDRDAKIIVCSAMSDKSTVMEAIKQGAKGYVIKPLDGKTLLDTINKLFEEV